MCLSLPENLVFREGTKKSSYSLPGGKVATYRSIKVNGKKKRFEFRSARGAFLCDLVWIFYGMLGTFVNPCALL